MSIDGLAVDRPLGFGDIFAPTMTTDQKKLDQFLAPLVEHVVGELGRLLIISVQMGRGDDLSDIMDQLRGIGVDPEVERIFRVIPLIERWVREDADTSDILWEMDVGGDTLWSLMDDDAREDHVLGAEMTRFFVQRTARETMAKMGISDAEA